MYLVINTECYSSMEIAAYALLKKMTSFNEFGIQIEKPLECYLIKLIIEEYN